MSTATEQHFTPEELAKRWHVDAGTVRRWFRDRPDVIRFGTEHRAKKRGHVSLRIPESVAELVYVSMRKAQ
jgi:hypothetical protein